MVSSPESVTRKVDEEESQGKARVAISVISFVVFSIYGLKQGLTSGETVFGPGLTTIVAYLLFSLVWYAMVKRYPNRYPRRRLVTIATDLGIMTVFMHLGSQHVTSYYPIFLWVIIGNGIRFGERSLQFGIVTGAAGFSSLLIYNDYWSANLNLGAGLLLGVVVLPLFFMGVLRRLRQVTALEVELAKTRLADRAKDQFLAAMSHELRTPMNGVLGMAEELRETDLDAEQQGHLEVITRSVESLLHIINDILDYSKLTASGLSLEKVPFDLQCVMADVHQLLRSTAETKGLQLDLSYADDVPRHFEGDPMRLRQIILNLVGNAIKFTETGHVTMRCGVSEKRPGEIELVVEDSGVGIPADRLSAIFKQFEQADNSNSRQFGGTGLGLAISRKLALLMGGEVDVRSVVGQGSVFTVSLALTEHHPVATPEAAPAPLQLPDYGFKALVVEDNKFNQVVMRNLARRIGIEVDVAENGAEALGMIEECDYDLVFMDIRMPVMNGYEATRIIRAREDELAEIPILAVTAEATRTDVSESRKAGMNLHLAKPLRVADLVSAINSLNIPVPLPV